MNGLFLNYVLISTMEKRMEVIKSNAQGGIWVRQHTFDFALIREPCQSFSSSSASGNLGLGGKLKYHCAANEIMRRTTVA
jgi:hypothetical protein